MPFDPPTRNRLARFVSDARSLLSEEFTRQLQHEYGLDPASGDVADLDRLGHLDDARRETARILRHTLAHYLAGAATPGKKARQEALGRIVREQAYTVLNRLAALRMAEARGLLLECVARGYRSQGFQLYAHLAGPALGETGAAYRSFLFSLFDELAVELPALFDRFSPQGRLFPREAALLRLLNLLNAPDLEPLWGEDETLGWIYQYFNTSEERRQMRAESQAPRDSRELAVRNQFFTPRYVVEFLTDNTLGRIWYEMTEGRTALAQTCRYLVRRPLEIFLPEAGFEGDIGAFKAHDLIFEQGWRALPEDMDWRDILELGLAVDGYTLEEQLRARVAGFTSVGALAGERVHEYRQTGAWRGNSLELWFCLFFAQRAGNYDGEAPDEEMLATLGSLYKAWRAALEREAGETDQAALLNQPVYIRPRPLKDPRQITMLDPACGSMHFGLYAFDLFERIYEEAWDMQARSKQLAVSSDQSEAPETEDRPLITDYRLLITDHHSLLTDYPTKAALLRDLPRLIIEHNLHGIDIDPRAVQIAGLSLWLRAQRSWQAQGLPRPERPTIRRAHIVCAEPMPGDKALLEEFLAGLREDRLERLIRRVLAVPAGQQVRATARIAEALCDLVRLVWQEMRLAGEAGSLLKIEETLARAVAAAEAEWSQRMPLFRVVDFDLGGGAGRVRYPRGLPGDEGADFWSRAEALVLAALQDYAEQAQNGAGYQRRLFAQDAVRGFAFIELCRKRYDVILMNPPFGDLPNTSIPYLRSQYPSLSENLYCGFTIRALELTLNDGNVGAISDRSFLIKQAFESFRKDIIRPKRPTIIIDLGWGVLDANVETCMTTYGTHFRETLFADVGKPEDLRESRIGKLVLFREDWVAEKLETFNLLPFTAFAYTMPKWMRQPYYDNSNRLDQSLCTVVRGMAGANADQLYRFVFEVCPADIGPQKKWILLQKGGPYSPFYFAPEYLLLHQAGSFTTALMYASGRKTGHEQYGLPGLSYGKRTDLMYAFVMNAGQVFSVEGQAIFPLSPDKRWQCLAILNSSPFQMAVNAVCGQHKLHGYVNALHFASSKVPDCGDLARSAYQLIQHIDTANELSLIFWSPLAVAFSSHLSLIETVRSALRDRNQALEECRSLHEEINRRVAFAVSAQNASDQVSVNYVRNLFGQEGRVTDEIHNLISWGLGCAMGRWSIQDSASGRYDASIPSPSDPLPICPPGMLQNAEGLPAAPADVPADYPLRISWPGILVDDPGHAEDIEARARESLRVIWPDNHDAIEQEACQLLGVGSLREYFASPTRFFDDHLKRYSKSRRVAPIYWPLSTPSGSYTLWLYYHRLSDQTLYTCVNDFVEPKLAEVRDQRSEIGGRRSGVGDQRSEGGGQRSERQRRSQRTAAEEKELERLAGLEAELTAFRHELLRLAAFWRPDLNDGVQITAAPLWRLFGHRAWRQRLQQTWAQLEAGDYDWAHLAMSIWPARVVPKCVDDRSLAIAHDLEDLFWVEEGGTWRTLRSPEEEIEGLVAAQRSPARARLAALLGELARGRARGLRCAEVWDELAAAAWDDLEASLLLWPARVAQKCWDDPLLAVTLQLTLPPKPTKAARERFLKEQGTAGCPDLAAALEQALAGRPDRFASFWSELARGDHDALPLALALWPDRVIAACAADADLAERHDVRRFLWVQGGDDVWRRRKAQKQEIADEVARRQGLHGG